MKIKTILIANRGEIACRIARAARSLGIVPVGIHSDADATALHVREIGRSFRVGSAPASESYLRIDAVLEAARQAGADAIHPGYGFLAENPEFARAVEDAGLIFVGPTPETLRRFGDKALAKQAAVAADVPVIPGSEGAFSFVQEIAEEVHKMGFPVLLKAVGGGGGRGQRLVEQEQTLEQDIEAAMREAKNAFGSEGLLLERMVSNARHVEIQIAGDGHGNVIHFYERDCSLQRRHQKVIEEAPAYGLPRELLDRIAEDAVRLGKSLEYRGLGTVEFLVSGDEYFFLEVNPRLQVEHPVTEAVTGVDLVTLHLKIAAEETLGLEQEQIHLEGHAVEARVYAEDPANGFAPSTGVITALALPKDIRVDTGVAAGDSVSPFYDPMIAKLIVHAKDRDSALFRLGGALSRTAVAGVDTNLAFLSALTTNNDVKAMQIHTRWIDSCVDQLTEPAEGTEHVLWMAVAAAIWTQRARKSRGLDTWCRRELFTGWRLGLGDPVLEASAVLQLTQGNISCEVKLSPLEPQGHFTAIVGDAEPLRLQLEELSPDRWRLSYAGEVTMVSVCYETDSIEIDTPEGIHVLMVDPVLAAAEGSALKEGSLAAPLTGAIVKVLAQVGDEVAAGDVIAILESMKMEIPIKSVHAGRLTALMVQEGDMIDRGQIVAEIVTESES